jgi:hypothetical protein
MIDYRTVAVSVADGLNGIARAMRAIPVGGKTPEFERWTREMSEASKHVLLAFGIDPNNLKNPSIPCGGGWYVEWGDGGEDGSPGEWHAVEKP